MRRQWEVLPLPTGADDGTEDERRADAHVNDPGAKHEDAPSTRGTRTSSHRHPKCFAAPLAEGSGERQLERELRAPAGLGVDPDPALHALDELAGDVEAETGAADALRHVRVEPVELVEDPVVLLGRDPEALVGDAEPHPGAVPLEPDEDPALVRVLD